MPVKQAMAGRTDLQQTVEYFSISRDSRMALLAFNWRLGKAVKGQGKKVSQNYYRVHEHGIDGSMSMSKVIMLVRSRNSGDNITIRRRIDKGRSGVFVSIKDIKPGAVCSIFNMAGQLLQRKALTNAETIMQLDYISGTVVVEVRNGPNERASVQIQAF